MTNEELTVHFSQQFFLAGAPAPEQVLILLLQKRG